MAGDMPYNLYAYDSYGTQTGSDYSNDSFSSYKGYDKGPFGYKTGVRQYDPETGRFLSPDAFKGYITDPASQHPYMYCHGNPVKFSDPSGYDIFKISSDRNKVLNVIRKNRDKFFITHTITKGACLATAQRVYNLLNKQQLEYYAPVIVWKNTLVLTKGIHTSF